MWGLGRQTLEEISGIEGIPYSESYICIIVILILIKPWWQNCDGSVNRTIYTAGC